MLGVVIPQLARRCAKLPTTLIGREFRHPGVVLPLASGQYRTLQGLVIQFYCV